MRRWLLVGWLLACLLACLLLLLVRGEVGEVGEVVYEVLVMVNPLLPAMHFQLFRNVLASIRQIKRSAEVANTARKLSR